MTLNTVIPSCAVLEVTMICIHVSDSILDNFSENEWINYIDIIFMVWIPVNFCYSLIWAVLLRQQAFSTKIKMIRIFQAVILGILGAAMMYTAFGVRKAADLFCSQKGRNNCLTYEMRAIIGIFALADSILHTISPVKEVAPNSNGLPGQGKAIDDDLPSYEAPPSYEDVEKYLQECQQANIVVPQTHVLISNADNMNHF